MKVVKVFVARSQIKGFANLEQSIMAEMDNGKIYCTHRQSTLHGFKTILKNSDVGRLNSDMKDGRMPHLWFECQPETTQKGEIFYKQI